MIGLCSMMITSHRSSKPKKKPLVEPVVKNEEIKKPEEDKTTFFIPSYDIDKEEDM